MTSRATLAHMVYWDPEFNRPLVDGNIAHPVTGEIQKGGRLGLVDGPPCVAIDFFNMNVENTKLRSIHSQRPVPMWKVYLAVAKLVKDGLIKLRSVNASEYSFLIICEIIVPDEKFQAAWDNMFVAMQEDFFGDKQSVVDIK